MGSHMYYLQLETTKSIKINWKRPGKAPEHIVVSEEKKICWQKIAILACSEKLLYWLIFADFF